MASAEFLDILERSRAARLEGDFAKHTRAIGEAAGYIADHNLANSNVAPHSPQATEEQRLLLEAIESGGRRFLGWTDDYIARMRSMAARESNN